MTTSDTMSYLSDCAVFQFLAVIPFSAVWSSDVQCESIQQSTDNLQNTHFMVTRMTFSPKIYIFISSIFFSLDLLFFIIILTIIPLHGQHPSGLDHHQEDKTQV